MAEPDAALPQLRAVQRFTLALHEAASELAFYDEAVDAVVKVLGVDRASLLLFDPDGVMRFKAWRGLSDEYRRAVEGHTPWSPGDTDAQPILVPDVAADPELEQLMPVFRAEGIGALGFVPLVHHQRVVGKFMLYYDRAHAFAESEVAVAEILAAHVALALERRQYEDALEEARARAETAVARLNKLQRVTAELSKAVSVDDVAHVVLSTALEELGGETGSLCMVAGEELEIAYSVGYPDAVKGHWGRFPLDADLPASEAVRTGRPVFIRSPEERDTRYPVFASTPVIGSDALVIIPLGERRPVGCLVVGFAEARTLSEQDESFFVDLAARCSAALERARLFDEREMAREAAERARARLSLLSRVSATLGATLDHETALARVAEMVVPTVADGCAVFLDGAGGLRPVAAHGWPDADLLARVAAFLPEPTAAAGAPGPVLVEDFDGGSRTLTVVPLAARSRVLGALALVNGPGRVLDDMVALAEEVASRAAAAVDNGRLFEERALIAQTLQASLLPPRLPDIPGIEVAARHVAAGAGVDVGGDFYDVFRLDERRFVAVLGDVCGRGVDAATVAALCRHTVRSIVVSTADPAAILGHVNEVLLLSGSDTYEPRFCTALVAVFTPSDDGVVVELALGGHPHPLVRRADGSITPVGKAGFLLGIVPSAALSSSRVVLHEGDALVCVTDGVLERRRRGELFGEAGLAAVVGSSQGDAEALARAVESQVLSFSQESSDDLAVLVLRVAATGLTGDAVEALEALGTPAGSAP